MVIVVVKLRSGDRARRDHMGDRTAQCTADRGGAWREMERGVTVGAVYQHMHCGWRSVGRRGGESRLWKRDLRTISFTFVTSSLSVFFVSIYELQGERLRGERTIQWAVDGVRLTWEN